MQKRYNNAISHTKKLISDILEFVIVRRVTLVYFIYPVFTLFQIIRWFHYRTLFATAEQGLHLYNPTQTFSVYNHTWLDIGLGIAVPFYVCRIPYYAFLSMLHSLGIASWLIQAAMYFFVITIGQIFVAKFVSHITNNEEKLVPHITALLYLCNLFVLSQIFIRFLDSLLFVWTFLPIFLYFWVKWIDTSRLRYLFGLLVASLFFAPIFTLIVEVLTIWIPAMIYSIVKILKVSNKKQIILLSLIGLLTWVIINSWWLYPTFHFRNNTYAELDNSKTNFASLQEVSQFYSISDIILLRQKYYFNKNGPWSVFYQSEKYYFISDVLLGFCVLGIIVCVKNKKNIYLIVVFMVSFFLIKGTNPPFGNELYNFLFKYIPATQVLRNPYEKLGVLFLLPYMLFSAIGINSFSKLFRNGKYVVVFIILGFCCFILVRPLFSKDVFPVSYYLNVPEYYQQANAYIISKSQSRIFHLPYFDDSTVSYDWGYTGEEPSEYLFSNISLAKTSHVPSIDNYYASLGPFLTQKDFPKLLTLINIDSIVLHNEYKSNLGLVEEDKSYMQNFDNVSLKRSFGKLDVYFINSYKLPGFIYTADTIDAVSSVYSGFGRVLDPNFDITRTVFVDTSDKTNPKNLIFPSLQKVTVRYRKVTNEKYIVHVKSAQKPFVLILSMSYNPNWQARSGAATFTKHFKVNGYANAWLVDKKGSYDIDVVFPVWPWE